MDNLVDFVKKNGETELPMIAESRGKEEDKSLRQVFNGILAGGAMTVPGRRVKKLAFTLTFQPKLKNIAGTQIADLCAYPCARYILAPQKPNTPYESYGTKSITARL